MMDIFYTEVLAKKYELNHFSASNENDSIFKHSRFISIDGDATFKSLSDYELYLNEDKNKKEWPNSVSIIINQNNEGKNTKQFSYSGTYSDDEVTIENSIEIAIDYNDEQFQYVWDMLLSSGEFKILIEAGISISSNKIDDIENALLFKNKELLTIESFNAQMIKP